MRCPQSIVFSSAARCRVTICRRCPGRSDRRCRQHAPAWLAFGFTLLELLIVLMIVALSAAFSAPAFSAWMVSARLNASTRALLATLNYARAEAQANGVSVRVCRSDSQGRCSREALTCAAGFSAPTDWRCGWAVRLSNMLDADGDTLRVHPAAPGVSIEGPQKAELRFEASTGSLRGFIGTFSILPSQALLRPAPDTRRCIVIDRSGRVRSAANRGCAGNYKLRSLERGESLLEVIIALMIVGAGLLACARADIEQSRVMRFAHHQECAANLLETAAQMTMLGDSGTALAGAIDRLARDALPGATMTFQDQRNGIRLLVLRWREAVRAEPVVARIRDDAAGSRALRQAQPNGRGTPCQESVGGAMGGCAWLAVAQ